MRQTSNEGCDLDFEETLGFLGWVLPKPPARVLDAGCGEGQLAVLLLERGYAVVGVEVETEAVERARRRGVPVVQADLLGYEDEPFDAVVFSRSLHHMHPLPRAVERARALTKATGLLVLEEFAIDRADQRTARWLDGMLELLLAAGALTDVGDEEPLLGPLERWRAERPRLHGGQEMLAEISKRFELTEVRERPYLYSYVCTRLAGGRDARRVARAFLETEDRLVQDGYLGPLGLRVVARPRA